MQENGRLTDAIGKGINSFALRVFTNQFCERFGITGRVKVTYTAAALATLENALCARVDEFSHNPAKEIEQIQTDFSGFVQQTFQTSAQLPAEALSPSEAERALLFETTTSRALSFGGWYSALQPVRFAAVVAEHQMFKNSLKDSLRANFEVWLTGDLGAKGRSQLAGLVSAVALEETEQIIRHALATAAPPSLASRLYPVIWPSSNDLLLAAPSVDLLSEEIAPHQAGMAIASLTLGVEWLTATHPVPDPKKLCSELRQRIFERIGAITNDYAVATILRLPAERTTWEEQTGMSIDVRCKLAPILRAVTASREALYRREYQRCIAEIAQPKFQAYGPFAYIARRWLSFEFGIQVEDEFLDPTRFEDLAFASRHFAVLFQRIATVVGVASAI